MDLASGELILTAAGDDISLPQRVHRTYEVYRHTNATSLFSNCQTIDEAGNPLSLFFDADATFSDLSPASFVATGSRVSGCSHAWTSANFGTFGPLLTPLTLEDWVIPFRSALMGKIAYIKDVLVKRRVHTKNTWNYTVGQNVDADIAFSRFRIFEYRNVYLNWLKDLDIALRIFGGDKKHLVDLQNTIRITLKDTDDQIAMLDAPLSRRIRIMIIRLLAQSLDIRRIRHDIGFFLMPKLYRRYLQLKQKMRR
jgi:hypothetical protein